MKSRTPLFIFIFFCLLILSGMVLGEPGEVYQKAVAICLSCIGIG